MNEYHQQLLPILERYLSPINARAFLDKAMRNAGLTANVPFECQHLTSLVARLTPSLNLFLGDKAAQVVIGQINKLGPAPATFPAVRVDIAREADIQTARNCARSQCATLQASSFMIKRVLTVVSELARNIVNYSKGGWIELQSSAGGVTITAVDRGPGIANLEVILAGNYRSRTGLGLGIIGVRRLAQHFSIETGSTGTRVEATVSL